MLGLHVRWMEEIRNAYTILIEILKEQDQFGRLSFNWRKLQLN
jgi:hypothetical protein